MAVMDQTHSQTHPLNTLCQVWLSKIRLAKRQRKERFGQFATEAKKFLDHVSNSWMWEEESARGPQGFLAKGGGHLPTFRMTINKLAECVALYGPSLYYQNPSILVSLNESAEYAPESLGFDRNDEAGMQEYQGIMQQLSVDKVIKQTHANIFQAYSNRIQYKADKKTHSRRAIVEAVVCGMSFLFCELYQPKGSTFRIPRSTYVSWEDVGFDPDADYEEDILWMFQECIHPVNMVEREYGLPEGSLKGNMQSLESQADEDANVRDRNKKRREGRSFDSLRYYKIWSKNGMGDKLMSKQKSDLDFASFGDYCFLAVAPGTPYPLNLPSSVLSEPLDDLVERAAWPIPFWQDEIISNGWPFSKLYFMDKPKSIWPIPIVKPVIGQMRFLNWIMSFLADKTAAACTTYVGRAKAAGVEIQNQLQSGLAPYTVLEISDILGKSVNDVVSFIQAPNFSIDIWRMATEVAAAIDKGLGTIDLLYGQTDNQLRSAKEAEVKQGNLQIRPEDMANRVEEFISTSCLKEMEAARWALTGEDIAPVLDNVAAQIWDTQIVTQEVDAVVRDFTFRVEAGSARKPNKQGKISQLREIGAVVSPVLQQFAAQGNPGPWNAYVAQLGKAMDFDPSDFMVAPPPPPPENQGPSPEEIQASIEQQKADMDLQAAQAKLGIDQQKSQLELAAKMQMLQMDAEKHGTDMAQDAQRHAQEMKQDKEEFSLQKRLLIAKSKQQMNGNGRRNSYASAGARK